jgi:hypothetical protein
MLSADNIILLADKMLSVEIMLSADNMMLNHNMLSADNTILTEQRYQFSFY